MQIGNINYKTTTDTWGWVHSGDNKGYSKQSLFATLWIKHYGINIDRLIETTPGYKLFRQLKRDLFIMGS